MIELSQLNAMTDGQFIAALADIFEHSPWIPERAAPLRPFASSIALHRALCDTVIRAGEEPQLALVRAHPELAGQAAIRGELTAASSGEQKRAGLAACTPAELQRLQSLNAAYAARFGYPFVLAVKGHTAESVIATLQKRTTHERDAERHVALREIFRIARFRLADLLEEPIGPAIIAMAEDLAAFSDAADMLTCTYLTAAHRDTAARIRDFMLAAGLQAHIDAVGNVIGVLPGEQSGAPRLLTGSHYDTVINAGKFDGRLGILLPIAVAGVLRREGVKLPFALEIIAFAEEEGVRFKSAFLGSRAVAGRFDTSVLDSADDQGVTLRQAMRAAGSEPASIASLARDPAQLLGFVEVHIEQGPVLLEAGAAVGVVSSIAGSIRRMVTVEGMSGHAGTVPMSMRRDAAAAAAEIVLAVERRCGAEPGLVGTVGKLVVPGGAVNVIPGRCDFSIDLRSGKDAVRDAAASDLDAEIARIAARRGVQIEQRQVMSVPSVPCSAALKDDLGASIRRITGRAALELPSGAGHDAMMMAHLTGVGMLFVRCGNGGISHHPAESLSADDAAVAAQVFRDYLQHVGMPS